MSKRNIVAIVSAMASVLLVTGSVAHATVYNFTFTSSSESIVGQLTVDGSDNQVTNLTGTLSGAVNDTINGFISNSSFPSPISLPDGAFFYDNVFYPGQDSLVDQFGLVFTTAGNSGGYWNLWSGAPGDYSLYEFEPRRRVSNRHKRGKPESDRSSGAFHLGDDADWAGRPQFRGPPPGSKAPFRAGVRIVSPRVDIPAPSAARPQLASFRGCEKS